MATTAELKNTKARGAAPERGSSQKRRQRPAKADSRSLLLAGEPWKDFDANEEAAGVKGTAAGSVAPKE